MARRGREWGGKASGLGGNPQTRKATRSIGPPGAKESGIADRGGIIPGGDGGGPGGRRKSKLESEREGCFRAGRYSRKSRE